MTARVAAIWRHPIKAHGREALDEVELEPGRTLPGDRVWAVAHDAARLPAAPGWAPCANFLRAAKAPALMAITASTGTDGCLTLRHPDRPELTFAPDEPEGEARFLAWLAPLCPPDRPPPARLWAASGRAMTDTDFPSLSLASLASHAAVAARIGRPLSPLRWRANILLDGPEPWAERGWIGRCLRLGEAELEVRAHITRCRATEASPRTGRRDADTLGALESGWGHREFGLYATVSRGGRVRCGDAIEVLP